MAQNQARREEDSPFQVTWNQSSAGGSQPVKIQPDKNKNKCGSAKNTLPEVKNKLPTPANWLSRSNCRRGISLLLYFTAANLPVQWKCKYLLNQDRPHSKWSIRCPTAWIEARDPSGESLPALNNTITLVGRQKNLWSFSYLVIQGMRWCVVSREHWRSW